MRSIYNLLVPIILLIGTMVAIWFLAVNLQPLQPELYAFGVCFLVGVFLVVKVFNNEILISTAKQIRVLTKKRHFVSVSLIAITVVGLIARLFFYFRFSYEPVSDPVTFLESAKTLSTGGNLHGDTYIALFPYLAAYDNLLALAVKLISDPWLATILLNTFFDLLAALGIFVLLKMLLKPNSSLPVFAFAVWVLNPLNIIFSVLSLPVIVVNFFIVTTILVTYLLIRNIIKLKTNYTLLLSGLLGVVMGYGNCVYLKYATQK